MKIQPTSILSPSSTNIMSDISYITQDRWVTYGSLLDLASSGLAGTEDESGDFDCGS
jgi:hypothetical protein